ncbi:MAG TPA: hypothetical protein VF202_15385 [Trueperaceae bacterium]|jgi:hypothetical protein
MGKKFRTHKVDSSSDSLADIARDSAETVIINPHREGPGVFLPSEAKIRQKYESLGGEATSGPSVETHLGKMWRFANAAIVYDQGTDAAYEIHGAIYECWMEAGGLKYGTPTTDEMPTSDGVGRFNHFNGGTASIYWSPQTGAHTIYGDIRRRWAALGWERSYLGYPISNEVPFADGGRANEFQHGGIYCWPDTGPIDLRDVKVRYTGLHCFGETDWDQGSDSDEPYVIFALTTPEHAWATTSRVYQDVDAGEQRPDSLELYEGRPYGLNIGIALMERDFGDPDRYRERVLKVVQGVHEAGRVALGLIPIVGPVIADKVGSALGELMPSVGQALSDTFNWGDDRVGSATVTVGARELVLLATRGSSHANGSIAFKIESPLVAGLGASYKVYFDVQPA